MSTSPATDSNTILGHPSALCAQADPEVWFPDSGGSNRAAKQICFRCPLLQRCRIFGITHPDEHGLWGGLSKQERNRIAQRIRVAS